ncbi:MAG: UbiX family flavin prenyltransferase [Acidobacteria bacterium]|nr:UbiX family flavin prenyltransferase [Acidobacteriota bacterium]
MANAKGKRLVVGISGASGIALAIRVLELAASHRDVCELHVVVSNSSLRVAMSELNPPGSTPAAILDHCRLDDAARAKITIHANADIGASIASGSCLTDGMVIVPCSAGTLASIAHGISRDLIQRAADLTLKERRRLVIALRETPLSMVHAENILTATRAGAIVMPPVPSFYAGQSWDDFLDHFAMRVLDLFDIDIERDDLRWKGTNGDD